MENLIKDDYLIIRENSNLNNDPSTPYLLVAKSQIETIAVSDTYDQFGQEITRGDAGDSMTLNTVKAVEIANESFSNEEGHEYTEHFEIGDDIVAYDYPLVYDAVIEKCEGLDYTLFQETVRGFNYWDGNNWKTVTIQVEHSEASHEVIDDKEIVEIISTEFATKEFVEDEKGFQRYASLNGWEFIQSQWAGDFESWTVFSPEMQEYRN